MMTATKPIAANGKEAGEKPVAYSYIRFSTPEQKHGDSIRRQNEAREAWCKRNQIPLDTVLNLKDEGKSAFTGAHRHNSDRHALAAFLELVENEKIARGSYLIVEALDRLTREDIQPALLLVLGLLQAGIRIVQLMPQEMIYDDSSENFAIMMMIMELSRGNSESAAKSFRNGEAWVQKRDEATKERTVQTKRAPAWLRVTGNRTLVGKRMKGGAFEVIPDAKLAIRKVFEMKLDGFGNMKIVQEMNNGKWWTPPGNARTLKSKTTGWRASYVRKVLTNRALIGEHQPCTNRKKSKRQAAGDVIENYFPVVIDPQAFHDVQRKLAERVTVNKRTGRRITYKGGRLGKASNLFRSLAKCPYCGGPMAFVDCRSRGKYRYRWLICDNGRCGARDASGKLICKRHSIRYEECEAMIWQRFFGLKPEDVLPNQDEQANVCKALRQRIRSLEAEGLDIDRKIDNLISAVMATSDYKIRARYEAKQKELDARKETLESEKVTAEAELTKAEQGLETFTAWQANLKTLRAKLDDVETRMKLQNHLQSFIERVDVFASGVPDGCDDDLPEEDLPQKGCTEEQLARYKHVAELRRTKAGRFLRIKFKTGRTVIFCPNDSVALSMSPTLRYGSRQAFQRDRVC
jgi:DNA invertase Pin-like site-specific DNA recombinase